ncbi:glutamine synthetase, beta-grasp domain protein, partial [Ancylostoma duodenale]
MKTHNQLLFTLYAVRVYFGAETIDYGDHRLRVLLTSMFGIARTAVTRLAQVRQPVKDLLRQSARSYGEFSVNIPNATPTVDTNMGIPFVGNKILATYVWVDGTGENLREKTRTLESDPGAVENYPRWSFDGSSTYQALKGEDSDMILKPAALYPDPFFGGNHKLVLCEVLDPHEKPAKTNHRAKCKEVMDKIDHTVPLFGMEQEYLFLDRDGHPLGWPKFGFPKPQ